MSFVTLVIFLVNSFNFSVKLRDKFEKTTIQLNLTEKKTDLTKGSLMQRRVKLEDGKN